MAVLLHRLKYLLAKIISKSFFSSTKLRSLQARAVNPSKLAPNTTINRNLQILISDEKSKGIDFSKHITDTKSPKNQTFFPQINRIIKELIFLHDIIQELNFQYEINKEPNFLQESTKGIERSYRRDLDHMKP